MKLIKSGRRKNTFLKRNVEALLHHHNQVGLLILLQIQAIPLPLPLHHQLTPEKNRKSINNLNLEQGKSKFFLKNK
jgi:hypothetical protein